MKKQSMQNAQMKIKQLVLIYMSFSVASSSQHDFVGGLCLLTLGIDPLNTKHDIITDTIYCMLLLLAQHCHTCICTCKSHGHTSVFCNGRLSIVFQKQSGNAELIVFDCIKIVLHMQQLHVHEAKPQGRLL